MHQYLDRQGDPFLKGIFDKYAERSSGAVGDITANQEQSRTDDSLDPEIKPKCDEIVKTDGLQRALLELGVPMEKTEKLMLMMDLDENGGLDFEEFKRAVQQPPTQLEQWASMLPLAGMLARSLPVSGGQGDQPLRGFSRLSEDGIDTAVEMFSEGLRRLLMQAKLLDYSRLRALVNHLVAESQFTIERKFTIAQGGIRTLMQHSQ